MHFLPLSQWYSGPTGKLGSLLHASYRIVKDVIPVYSKVGMAGDRAEALRLDNNLSLICNTPNIPGLA